MAIYVRPFVFNFLTLTLFPLGVLADQNWSVTDGTTVKATEGYNSTDSTIPLYMAGAGSMLVTDHNLSFSTTKDSTYAAHIRQQAGLTLNNASLSSEGKSAFGIYLYQNASLVMAGGSVKTTGDMSNAVQAIGSTLSLTDAVISTTGAISHALYMSAGTLEADNVQLITSGTSSTALYMSGGASATLNNIDIDQNSRMGAYGIALYNSSLTGNQLDVTSVSTTMPAILAGKGGTLTLTDSNIHSGFTGIRLLGGSATLNNVNVATTQRFGLGLDVNIDASATVTGGSYVTSGNSAHGVWLAHASSTLDVTGSTFTTRGTGSLAVNGQSGTSVVTDSVLTTYGNYGYGYYTEYQAKGSGLDITTSGTFSYGAMTRGGAMALSDSAVTTSGMGGYGLFVMAAGVLTASDVAITTSGATAPALFSSGSGSTIAIEDSSIITSSAASSAAKALNGGSITLLNSTLTTMGDESAGLLAQNDADIIADGITVSTSGSSATALQTSLSTLTVSNSQLSTIGQAVGMLATSHADGQQSTVTLDNVVLTSEQSTAVMAQGSDLELDLRNGTVITGGDGVALRAMSTEDDVGVVTHSTMTVAASDNVSLLGNIIADSVQDTLTVALSNYSRLVGITQNVSQLTLDSTSSWLINGDATVVDLQHDGVVSFGRDTSADTASRADTRLSRYVSLLADSRADSTTSVSSNVSFSTLTVTGDLTGSGEFILRTELGDDQCSTDRILVEGNAIGDFTLSVINQNGMGALTGVGILMVKVAGDASLANFTQKGSVVAGLYEYFLNRVGENSWYLQSSYTPDATDDDSTDSGTTDSDDVTTWRPEIAGYTIAPYMNAAYGFQSAGNYRVREGAYQAGSTVWGRTYGRHDRYRSGRFAYNANSVFVQLGGDVLHQDLNRGWHVKAGPMLTLGRVSNSNHDNVRSLREGLSTWVGKTETTAYGAGSYLTFWHDDGSYLDTIAQLTRYSNRFSSLTQANMTSYSALLSAEVGKPFIFYKQIGIEPQFQLLGQYMNIREGYASSMKLKGQNIMTGQARWGGRLFYDAAKVQPYLKLDLVRQLGQTPGMIVDDHTFRPRAGKGYWQAGAGITGKVADRLNLYAEASYIRTTNTGLEGYNGNLGIRYQF
ncbi:autotransporter outer membrane beta-barrel domain-containing protein [Erwinia tracheiphila]|uniref:Autotransporter outer membrane beta-barrel domain-containing protein n=1 Tax=Erwinia tracheiphila TaxID=65700 RepID=A0A345CYN8_9GAMM|nr:autotransporter outer membrane beta-barrel domain-containing protein [Erwinia tracheiphila]AXF78555.1 autotransporter outer membrane beta-barrel domain-containing protein [Erwinia tracheiphila]UIA82716.1 autotransporter outer membrane beta-barrel domain-containing protein [Erwinia tracheiphila]UIA91299.1 autotransporter outer membrane beta-barrel domain-containing protein [Erwinia tracheiphila]